MESERQFRNTTPRDLTILEHDTYRPSELPVNKQRESAERGYAELAGGVHPEFRRDETGTSPIERELLASFASELEAAFNRAVRISDEKRSAICNQRGGEYLDSWAVENVHTPRLDAVLKAIAKNQSDYSDGHSIDQGVLTNEEKRLILIAALADVKLSRWGGPFKDDTPIDECNYVLALTTWLNEYLGR